MTTLLAVSGQVEFKVYGSKLSRACARGVCWHRIHLLQVLLWMLERTVGQDMNGVSFGQDSYTDPDFAGDVSLMAELLNSSYLCWRRWQVRQLR